MSGNICFSVLKGCKADMWSYGEICVGCNCCGRISKGIEMYEARVGYYNDRLENEINFDNWIEGVKDIQKENVKTNIRLYKAKLKYTKNKIVKLKI